MVDDFLQFRYGWEKFHGAVHSLCSDGPIKERLVNAYIFNISHLDADNDIPESVRNKFKVLIESLTSALPEGEEGRVHATVQAMDETAIHDAVSVIIGLYDALCRFMPSQHLY